MTFRPCSRVACLEPSVATLTFDYGESLAVLGPLSSRKEPHSFDLCSRHGARPRAPPRGGALGAPPRGARPPPPHKK
ncbi:MAG: DUF3499 domain-containing protein, partial [Cryobacterium sp.]|uniref:DUF3499 family protein n=1 Tax=Cryobacterium sp. TaxID=1926290 RepID=UPI002289BF54